MLIKVEDMGFILKLGYFAENSSSLRYSKYPLTKTNKPIANTKKPII